MEDTALFASAPLALVAKATDEDEPPTLVGFLNHSGLAQYTERMHRHGIHDLESLQCLDDTDLREIGLVLGHRVKLQNRLKQLSDQTLQPQKGQLVAYPSPGPTDRDPHEELDEHREFAPVTLSFEAEPGREMMAQLRMGGPGPKLGARELSDIPGPQGLTKEQSNACVAAGKAVSILMKVESHGYCGVEKSSIYGAVVALPQIARSVKWSATMIGIALRSYLLLFLNILLQGFLICMIGESAQVMNPFGGQMHLCDFGASIPECPGVSGCIGPDGTVMSYPRLYGFNVWNARRFFRDTLVAVLPDRAEEIRRVADPGEYGLENYYCRGVCCFIFMMAVVDDLRGSIGLASLLWNSPTRADCWISYDVPDWADKDHIKKVHNCGELDFVKYQVAGMPLHWKLINFTFVLVPKVVLWLTLVNAGFHFLMETSTIVDLVVNAMALTFVLGIDEMVFQRLMSAFENHLMEKLEDLPLFETHVEEHETEEEVLKRYTSEELSTHSWLRVLSVTMPWRLLTVIGFCAVYMAKYYMDNCVRGKDGSWISKEMYLPGAKDIAYISISYFFTFLLGEDDGTPFWNMPAERDL